MTRTQIFIVHGGMTFKSKKDYLNYLSTREVSIEERVRWSDSYLEKKLGQEFEIIRPRMPLQDNAKYEEWKIYFERFFPQLKNNIILIGKSLGGVFLAKYLSENKFPKKILSTYLICPPHDNSLPGEDLVGGFNLKGDLSLLEKSSKNLYLMFSQDDNVVPLRHAKKYKDKLNKGRIIIFDNKNGHFRVSEFPEIVKQIKDDVRGGRA